MVPSWLRSVLILAVILCALAGSSSAAVGGGARDTFLVGRPIEQEAHGIDHDEKNRGGASAIRIAQSNLPISPIESSMSAEANGSPSTRDINNAPSLRGSVHRRLDLEDMLQEMARKDPQEWDASEWLVMILFLSFFGWLGCCLCTLCCCGGRGGGSNLLGWLCFWEICCRGGTDIDRCCDYALA